MNEATGDFPFRRFVNLSPLIDYWRSAAAGQSPALAAVARAVLAQVESNDVLSASHADCRVLEEHQDLVDLLASAVFPPAYDDRLMGAVLFPFRYEPVFQTAATRNRGVFEQLALLPVSMRRQLVRRRAMNAYHVILEGEYGVPVDSDHTLVLQERQPSGGEEGWLRVVIDPSLCTLKKTGPLPALSDAQIRTLLADQMNLELWTQLLPPDRFEFHGVVVLRIEDVTGRQVLASIQHDLLKRGALTNPDHLVEVQRHLRTLLHRPRLELGLISVEQAVRDGVARLAAVGRSLLLDGGSLSASALPATSVYASAAASDQPTIVYDLASSAGPSDPERRLAEGGLRNLVLAPLRLRDRLIGLLEIASPNEGDLHELNTHRLAEVTDLFATTLQRSIDEREDRVQAVIKEHYTAIHPVVEWRFRDVAQDYLRRLDAARRDAHGDEESETVRAVRMEPIVFRDVYPLYGLSDIRGSSTNRNMAIERDLVDQLGLALNIFVEAGVERWLPALDELGYRVATFAQEIDEHGLLAGDEVRVLEFLRHDVEPLLDQLADFGPRTSERVQRYREGLDPRLGVLYNKRKAFEDSITQINETIANYIDRQEAHAQAIVPHYFEKFKTDGVDYNVYAGASLVQDGRFTLLHLSSLRLWQLMMTCGIAWELEALAANLPMPLDVAHLVLVHSTPLAIRFRHDEKQFDVDGAYNIRYEIVKKRIDKATIRGTSERLTQPGAISIVYDNERDLAEYRRYIDYMKAANYVTSDVEDLALDELQGVSGLRALRVHVRPGAADHEPQPTPSEALKSGLAGATPAAAARA